MDSTNLMVPRQAGARDAARPENRKPDYPYAPVPDRVLSDSRLKGGAFRLACSLARWWKTGVCTEADDTLARWSAQSVKSVQRARALLVGLGYTSEVPIDRLPGRAIQLHFLDPERQPRICPETPVLPKRPRRPPRIFGSSDNLAGVGADNLSASRDNLSASRDNLSPRSDSLSTLRDRVTDNLNQSYNQDQNELTGTTTTRANAGGAGGGGGTRTTGDGEREKTPDPEAIAKAGATLERGWPDQNQGRGLAGAVERLQLTPEAVALLPQAADEVLSKSMKGGAVREPVGMTAVIARRWAQTGIVTRSPAAQRQNSASDRRLTDTEINEWFG